MKKYIHYGHKRFEPDLFNPVKNIQFRVKPSGGLWASSYDAVFSWKDWCTNAGFRTCTEDNKFSFYLSDSARVLRIESPDSLANLPKAENEFMIDFFPWVFLDFEKIAESYDAIEVIVSNHNGLAKSLYTWDCDSILIMNPDVIVTN